MYYFTYMGYEDPELVADRIARAASELTTLIAYYQQHFGVADDFKKTLSDTLEQQAEFLDGIVREFQNIAAGVINLPKTDSLAGMYSVAGIPVWRVRHRARLRGRRNFDDYRPPPAEAEIVIYLDKYTDSSLEEIQSAAVRLGGELGYADFILTDEQLGSIFRRLRGKLRTGIESDFVQQKMRELDERSSIEISGRARAETDAIKTSNAVSLIASLAEIPNAVVRVGGLLIVKQTDVQGAPAIITRELSTREIRALELNPGIQKDPHGVLQLLAMAVAQLEEDEQDQ